VPDFKNPPRHISDGGRSIKEKGLRQMDADIKSVMDSIFFAKRTTLYGMLVEAVSRNLFTVLTDMLEMAVEIAPYRTGELRESGVVDAFVGSGRTSMLIADVDADKSGSFTVNQKVKSLTRPYARIETEISFKREGEVKDPEGNIIALDIALWAHEDLLPYAPRPKRESLKDYYVATKKGVLPKSTGPKYLSRAVDQYKHRIQGLMEEATEEAIRKYNAKYGGKARRRVG
jgi:hypothetical protein